MYASPSRYSALGLFACRCARCCASAIAWSVSEPAAHDGAAQRAETHSRRMSAKVFMDESERAGGHRSHLERQSVGQLAAVAGAVGLAQPGSVGSTCRLLRPLFENETYGNTSWYG